jgi:hypothetical protein
LRELILNEISNWSGLENKGHDKKNNVGKN